jgi:glycosyltransferase involved in cell wall biosynthesis
MISVLIPTLNSERFLVATLSSLVAGAAAGLLREVILADGGSTDGTARIADAAGCDFREDAAGEAERLRTAAAGARGSWLLILRPESAPEEGWTREVAKFIDGAERAGRPDRAAAFRYAIDAYGFAPRLREVAAAARATLIGPRPEQGLLVSKHIFAAGRRARPAILRTRVILPG